MCTTQTDSRRRGVFVGAIASNRQLCREHYKLVLRFDQFPPTAPGQFIQLQCRSLREQVTAHEVVWELGKPPHLTQPELTNKEPMLRRPLSIGGRRDLSDGVELEIIYRAAGAGTRWLSAAPVGERLSVLGPLGNAFTIRPDKPRAVVVGGGVGIPPMIYLAQELAKTGRQTVAFCGTRTAQMLPLTLQPGVVPSPAGHPMPCVQEFAQAGVETVIATDDGSAGFGGVVSEALRNWLNASLPAMDDLVVYSCGPEPMMQALAQLCLSRGYECQLALERHMACGMGTCQSCVVRIRDDSERGWSFKLCCTDGPVFDARDLLW